jgi:class 3 adenylate cyclase/predicted ATPase
MRCSRCGSDNRDGRKFCAACGAPLVVTCPKCDATNQPEERFCGECGAGLAEATVPKRPEVTPIAVEGTPITISSSGERRQLTVMFCDLVGSTPLAEKLDPEDLRQVILAYQQTCAEQIRRFEGYLAHYVGDGLLVYFGYPLAHEDDGPRAIRAALGMVAVLPALNARLQQTVEVLRDSPLQVRIGIHTGLVVAGDMGGGGYRDPLAIVGETPNIAARLQGIAKPNTVVISEATARLVQGLFECHDRGHQKLKGISTPVPVYRVLRESEAKSRFEVAVRTGLTPLVGREEELGLLRRRWEQAKAGEGQVVLLSGEPGIGKSRLMQTLKKQASGEDTTCMEFRCSPYYQNSAFYPILDHWQGLLQFAPHETAHAKLTKLQQALAVYHFPQMDTLALLAAWLSLPHPDGVPLLTLSPNKQKEKTQEALVAWLVEEAERAAVYCAWEDLHWADPSTLDVLTLFLEQVPSRRLLAVLTFRPEFLPPWGNRSHLSHVMLSRLRRPQVEAMVERVTDGKALPPEVVEQIVAKTDGVPLFVEELTKMVVESGLLTAVHDHYELSGPLPPLAIPATLQDSLMARLDRLSTVREIAQLGATLGRKFDYELLHAVSPLDEERLQEGLKQLVQADLVYQGGRPPQAHYLFKHMLIQDTAYQSLLKSTRQQYHRQIAQVLADRFSDTVETQPELVAHHYTEASLVAQAIPYWQRAGERATQRSAYAEAVAHFTKGLELFKTLPKTAECAQDELTLQIALGTVLMMTKGYAAPDVANTYARAHELCRDLGETPYLFPALRGLWQFYQLRAELQTARGLGEQLLRLAQDVQDPALLLEAHSALGETLFVLGEFPSSHEHSERGIALYDPQQHSSLALVYGQDPGVLCSSFAANALGYRGYMDQALKRSHEALALAQILAHPFSQTYALLLTTFLHQLRRDGRATFEQAGAVIARATEQGFAFLLAGGTCLQGWALVEQGQEEEGIAQLRHGLAAYQATATELGQPYFLCLLAGAYGKVEHLERALCLLAEAAAMLERGGQCWYEAELYRVKGELTLKQSGVRGPASDVQREAGACFWKAVEIARRQQAKSLELRAVMSVARLWQSQGRLDEARQIVAEIYGWFTEGFDTADLKDAKALLDELSS